MTDDPARMTDMSSESGAAPTDGTSVLAQAYIQLTEAEATPLDAADAIERRDQYGRVPVVVRIRRQPPINPVWILRRDRPGRLRAVPAAGSRPARHDHRRGGRRPGGRDHLAAVHPRAARAPSAWSSRAAATTASCSPGIRRVSPLVALSHLVTTREIAFDVPVSEVRSADGVGVAVDVLLTLRIADPVKFAYAITPGDADQFVQAACQDAVRTLVRGIEAMSALDLNSTQSDSLRQVIDPKLDRLRDRRQRRGLHAGHAARGAHRLPRGATPGIAPAGRAGGELRARQAPPRRPGRARLPGGRVPAIRRGVRGRGRGAPAGDARGADRGQPERRPLRPGALPDPRGRAARRQQPGRGVAGGDGPHVEPADGARGRGRERRGRCGRRGGRRRRPAPKPSRPERSHDRRAGAGRAGESGETAVPGESRGAGRAGPAERPRSGHRAGEPRAWDRRRSGHSSRSPPSSSSWSARSRCARSRRSSCPWCSACSSRSSRGPWSASWSGAVPATPSPSPPP